MTYQCSSSDLHDRSNRIHHDENGHEYSLDGRDSKVVLVQVDGVFQSKIDSSSEEDGGLTSEI